MKNMPSIKLGIIAVSRDCFPIALSERRRKDIVNVCKQQQVEIFEAQTAVENEVDMLKALEEVRSQGVNSLVVFLGNFGPETPETMIAKHFDGPVMYVAAAEEAGKNLFDNRGDAYCGMLNCSYNLQLRNAKAYIPEYPVGTAQEITEMIQEFIPLSRAVLGLKNLKVFTFGPRPWDFFACNAPIKPLFDLGIEIQENSELDLFISYRNHADDARIPGVVADMEAELGIPAGSNNILPRLARYELTLLDWAEAHKGSREYYIFANKCWPAFETEFGFVPCFVNSRLASRGIPVACEVDIYGAVSEYIGSCITEDAVTILDINNSVPSDIYEEDIKGKFDYTEKDIFMGFHCGNTPSCKIQHPSLKFQFIMKRSLEPDSEPDITRGTLEGDIIPGEITFFRLQSNASGELKSYIAQGDVLPVASRSFGAIGIFAIPEMKRFYRHVLIEKGYPHHGAVAFGHIGKTVFALLRYLGIQDIAYNQPKSLPYPTENPFA